MRVGRSKIHAVRADGKTFVGSFRDHLDKWQSSYAYSKCHEQSSLMFNEDGSSPEFHEAFIENKKLDRFTDAYWLIFNGWRDGFNIWSGKVNDY